MVDRVTLSPFILLYLMTGGKGRRVRENVPMVIQVVPIQFTMGVWAQTLSCV